jgi:hypothetical protein
MIAGGVGISPLCSVIANLLSTAPAALARLHVLWSIRDDIVRSMYMPLLQRAVDAGATVTVHDSSVFARAYGPSAPATGAATAATTPTATATADAPFFGLDGRPLTARYTSSTKLSTVAAVAAQQQKGQQRKSFRAPWNVRSPLWSWFVGATMLFLSTAGSNAGFLASRAVCSAHPITASPAVVAAYEAAVLANYAAAHSGASPANGWPNGQSRAADATVYEQRVLGQQTTTVMRCTPGTEPVAPNSEWRYGQPAPCRDLITTWMCPGVVTPLLSWGLSLLLALTGGVLLARYRAAAAAKSKPTVSRAAVAAAAVAGRYSESGSFILHRQALPTLYPLSSDDAAFSNNYNGTCVELVAGRPDINAYMRSLAADLDISTSSSSSSSSSSSNSSCSNVLDVYVCGNEQLQSGARSAFERYIAPASRGSSFFGLRYAIG